MFTLPTSLAVPEFIYRSGAMRLPPIATERFNYNH